MILRQRFYQRVFKEGWVLKRLVVIKSIKLGTTDGLRMNLAKKKCICDVITWFIY